MSGFTLTLVMERLDAAIEAERAILEDGQSQSVGARSHSEAELTAVRNTIAFYRRELAALQREQTGHSSFARAKFS